VELSQLLHLSADGYIYHPEFLTFDTGVKLEAIEGLAGQSDDRLLWGGDFRFNFLEKRQNSLSIHGTRSDAESAQPFSETYTVTNELYGATFFQKWGWIPFDLSYLHGSRSGGLGDQLDDSWDKVLFDGSYQIGERSEGKLGYGLIFEKIQGVDRRRQNLSASNTSYLGEGSNKRLNTYLSLFEERNGRVLRNAAGSTEFNWEHAEDLRTRYVLRGFWSDTEAQNTTTLNPSFFLDHQLYDSLETRLEIFGRLEDSSFRKRQEFGGSISENYLKQLGGWGQLNISVAPHVSVTRSRPNGNTAFVFDEEHLMVEEDEVLLRQPDIIESTIVVTDTSGSIVYDRDEGDGLGGDYTVTQSGDGIETELARTINSTIADPQLVLVDYQYELAEDNDTLFTGVNVHTALYFFGDWSVFGRYDNIDHYVLSGDKEDIRFNDFNKYVFGLRFNGLWLTAKAKFEEKDATTGSYRSYSGGATFSTYGTVTWNAHLRANYAYLDRIDSGETASQCREAPTSGSSSGGRWRPKGAGGGCAGAESRAKRMTSMRCTSI
jgi:hypothetical protein